MGSSSAAARVCAGASWDALSAAAAVAAPAKRAAPAPASIGTLAAETIALVNPQKNYAQFLLRALLPTIIDSANSNALRILVRMHVTAGLVWLAVMMAQACRDQGRICELAGHACFRRFRLADVNARPANSIVRPASAAKGTADSETGNPRAPHALNSRPVNRADCESKWWNRCSDRSNRRADSASSCCGASKKCVPSGP
jgi:hypothetical protein